ncbi:hypothetical protein [Cyclobacterium amurskyense]|nr:hypothetical protein [Cyclobacterium amurskyense]|tara:strand:+ start:290 stop:427 length:138 start_codon:yes stop_codon:yes gene_type:complete
MASTTNSNQKDKKEWVNPEFLTENIQETNSGGWSSGSLESGWYGS